MSETWKQIPSEPNYEASSHGRIRRCKRGPNTRVGRVLLLQEDRGYLCVSTSHDGQVRRRAVHQLVAEAFHGACPEGLVAKHKDGNSANNAAPNLEYGTQRSNILDKIEHGTMVAGEAHHAVSVSDELMLVILRDAKIIGQRPAARKHGVRQSLIGKVLAGKSRRYLLERL